MKTFTPFIKPLFFAFIWLLIAIGFSSCTTEKLEEQPNIVIFFTDDQGYADVGCFGAEGFETPNLDQLAKEGLKLTNFYVAATVCTPSRAALLTGKYPKRLGLHEAVIFPFSEHGLDPDEYTLAELLNDQGYTTSCIGKWHLGHKSEYMPNSQGFDTFYGVPYSNDMDGYYYKHLDFQSPPLPFYRNEELIGEGLDQQYLTKMYTEEAVRQIKDRSMEAPFFLYLAHSMPHTPLYASEKFLGKSKKGLYGDVIMELDWSAGEIVKALKEEGIFDNTIFIFTSDNGPQIGSAKPLRGLKAQTWEGGQRVPAIITWPLKIPKGSISDEMMTSMDFYPTLAKIAGAILSEDHISDGNDIRLLLENPGTGYLTERPFYYYARNGDIEAMRLGKWKLHIKKSIGWQAKQDGDFQLALYDLDNDISESTNVANDFPDVAKKLSQQLLNFDSSLNKN
jgi:arylsulfatase A-like enzyme